MIRGGKVELPNVKDIRHFSRLVISPEVADWRLTIDDTISGRPLCWSINFESFSAAERPDCSCIIFQKCQSLYCCFEHNQHLFVATTCVYII